MAYFRPFFKGFPKTTSLWPIFLVSSFAFLNIFAAHFKDSSFTSRLEPWNAGGPISNDAEFAAGLLSGVSAAEFPVAVVEKIPLAESGMFLSNSNPSNNVNYSRGGLKIYKVKKGDTLSSIAADFGLDLETLRSANPELKSRNLRLNQELAILPVSGILYEVKSGDSLESVAARYRVEIPLVKQYNGNYQKIFETPGKTVILPYAKPIASAVFAANYANNLLNLKNYFTLPAKGRNWGELHDYNAVDIADQCGKPVYASAEGLVIPDDKFGDGASGWNGGYGLFILLEHPNGVKTRYAHNGKNLVKPGDYVSQNQEIALIGNTGNTHGSTGCHVHFEVYGAKNPFAVK